MIQTRAAIQPATNEYFVYESGDAAIRFDNAQKLSHRYLYGPATDQAVVDEVFSAAGQSQRVLWQLADH